MILQRISLPTLLLVGAILAPKADAVTYSVSASEDGMDLTEALKKAGPGDKISLEDGIYDTALESYTDGEKGNPITIKGSRDAIINGDNGDSRSVLINHSYITLRVSSQQMPISLTQN